MTKQEWSCGHTAGSMCQECFGILARKSTELAAENMFLRCQIEELRAARASDQHRLFHYERLLTQDIKI